MTNKPEVMAPVEVRSLDPVIVQMFKRLPERSADWPLDDRVLWLQAMESVLHMVYGRVETIDISGLAPPQAQAVSTIVTAITEETAARAAVQSSDEPTDKALAEAEGAASGSSDAKTTKAPDADRMGSEWSSSSETKSIPAAPAPGKRPPGIPTNLEMAKAAINALGPTSAAQIREYVRKQYWVECPDGWTGCLWTLASEGKLARAGINFVLAASAAPEQKPQVLPKAPVSAPMPPVKPTQGARPAAPAKGFKFDHDGKSTELGSSRLYVLASKLKAAMGKGHVAEAFLAENVIGSNTDRHRTDVKDMCLGMNDQLESVGLRISYYSGFGLIMKEIGG